MRDLRPVRGEPADGGVRSDSAVPGLWGHGASVVDVPGTGGWCIGGWRDDVGAGSRGWLRVLRGTAELERGGGLSVWACRVFVFERYAAGHAPLGGRAPLNS